MLRAGPLFGQGGDRRDQGILETEVAKRQQHSENGNCEDECRKQRPGRAHQRPVNHPPRDPAGRDDVRVDKAGQFPFGIFHENQKSELFHPLRLWKKTFRR